MSKKPFVPLTEGCPGEGRRGAGREDRGARPLTETPNPKPPQGGSGTARPQGNKGTSKK
jgi:hypothetical protein